MPSTLNAPGIYIEELPSGVRPIVGVSTSDTAFVDWFPRGPVGVPTRVTNFDEFARKFGGLHTQGLASYAIYQYFLHGGAAAWVVRADFAADNEATLALVNGDGDTVMTVVASSPGQWGENVEVAVTSAGADTTKFNLFVRELSGDRIVDTEVYRNLSADPAAPDYGLAVVNAASRLVQLKEEAEEGLPVLATPTATGEADPDDFTALAADDDEAVLDVTGAADDSSGFNTALKAAMGQLASIDPFVFNILCIPAMAALEAADQADLVAAAATFCEQELAFLLVDPPAGTTDASAAQGLLGGTNPIGASKNAAIYYPRLVMPDPLNGGRPKNIAPGGAVAGVYAKTDATRGVWKAPAGIEATLGGVSLAVTVNDGDSASLNPLGINALRTFPVVGNVVWGARTLFGADQRASEWKYVSVRRTALFIEQSLRAGLTWVVFEPNDEPLWSQIRLNVGAFMQDLFRKQAFQGLTPREAYFVRCDKTTTTQSDIDKGIVNILVGFAPLKPAEFVVIQIQQIAGQAAA
jgi:phage tail sheath protein FI